MIKYLKRFKFLITSKDKPSLNDSNKLNHIKLEDKIQKSKEILSKDLEPFKNSLAIVFTGSKETTVILDLIRDINKETIPYTVVHIDTGIETEELYDYREIIQRIWNFKIMVINRKGILSPDNIGLDPKNCCKRLKQEGLFEAIKQNNWKVLILDPRDSGYKEIDKTGITIINPVTHFDELDFWKYIKQKNLPYCSLYRKGFRLVACEPCLRPWLRKIEPAGENKEEIISRLKSLGYF